MGTAAGPPAVAGVFAGLATLDVVHHLDVAPGPDAKATAHRQDVAAGGPATGAAVAFAVLGGHATLVTALGSHPVAALVRHDLPAGVTVLDLAGPGSVPAVSAVRVSPAGRSVTGPDAAGAAVTPTAADLAALAVAVRAAGVVLVDGHHPALARAAADAARAAGVPLLVDAGRPRPVLVELVARADLVVASAGWDLTDLTAPAAAAVTAGAGPVAWRAGGRTGQVVPPPVDAVDTLGAGDTFHGAVAHRVARDGLAAVVDDWPGVLAAAAAVAAARVSRVGPHAWRAELRPGGARPGGARPGGARPPGPDPVAARRA